jgi:hypothetical protein
MNGCEVCGAAEAVCTAGTDDGDLELCAGCAGVLRASEGWRLGEPSHGAESYVADPDSCPASPGTPAGLGWDRAGGTEAPTV